MLSFCQTWYANPNVPSLHYINQSLCAAFWFKCSPAPCINNVCRIVLTCNKVTKGSAYYAGAGKTLHTWLEPVVYRSEEEDASSLRQNPITHIRSPLRTHHPLVLMMTQWILRMIHPRRIPLGRRMWTFYTWMMAHPGRSFPGLAPHLTFRMSTFTAFLLFLTRVGSTITGIF